MLASILVVTTRVNKKECELFDKYHASPYWMVVIKTLFMIVESKIELAVFIYNKEQHVLFFAHFFL
jgi:hypothetical protein